MKIKTSILILFSLIMMVQCNFWDIQRRPNQLICETCKRLAYVIRERPDLTALRIILRLNEIDPRVKI